MKISASITLILFTLFNTAPTVSITTPVQNQFITAGSNLTITAKASDKDGWISKVEIFSGSALVSMQKVAPFTTTIKNIQPGVYIFKARATDNAGSQKTSTSITVYVFKDYAKELKELHDSLTALKAYVNKPDTTEYEGATVTHPSPTRHHVKILK
jgi:hypothetical protein